MSIISRALNKMKHKPSKKAEHDPLDYADGYNRDGESLNAHIDDEGLADIKQGEVDIFIGDALNEELDLSEISITDLDYDLSEEMDQVTGFPPQHNVLEINPLKKFSSPVDLNLNQLHLHGFITPHHADTHLSNTFRMIKRPLLNNAAGKGASKVRNQNVIMVTSSVSGEGKTYSAINLAISIAMEKNKRVLLIDADVNKPSHHKELGVHKEQNGLLDFLQGRIQDMSQVMFKTNIPSLSLMFAGRLTSHATELLASDAMGSFVDEVSMRYPDRIIIFDSPPLLMTTEACVLASHMGQVVLVVEAETRPKNEVQNSLALLQNEIVLLLLNKMREKNEASQYGYYGYGHQS